MGHGVYLKYLAWDIGGVIVHNTVWSNTSHAIGEEWRQVDTISTQSGVWIFLSEICVNDAGSMNSIGFDQTSNKYIVSNIGILNKISNNFINLRIY